MEDPMDHFVDDEGIEMVSFCFRFFVFLGGVRCWSVCFVLFCFVLVMF